MMQLSAEILQALPRAGPSVFAGPIPTISKPNAKPIAGAFVEVTTKEKAARVHRNRQLAAMTLAAVKQTISTLESTNAALKKRDAELSATLAELLTAVSAKTTAAEA